MKLALAQMDVFWEDKDKNKITCEGFLKKAKEAGVDIVAFPEMTLTGFSQDVSKIGETNEETINWFKNKSLEYDICICFGYVEKGLEKGKNKLAVISKDGRIINSYTKIHPFSYSGEDKYYEGGNEINLFKLQEADISTFICYDLRFPEIFQIASKKAQLIIVIANWPKSRSDAWKTLLKARAIENQCFIAGVNRIGSGDGIEYSGDSMIINPKGNILKTSHNKEELLIEEIQINEVSSLRDKFPYKRDRKEVLYSKLLKDSK